MRNLPTISAQSSANERKPDSPPSGPALEIIALHGEILTAARTSLHKAIRIGELLVEQKARLDHGRWLPWIKEHLPFSPDTAGRYMVVFKHRDQIPQAAEFRLTDAYRLLAAPAEPDRKPRQTKPPAPASATMTCDECGHSCTSCGAGELQQVASEPDEPPRVVAHVEAMKPEPEPAQPSPPPQEQKEFKPRLKSRRQFIGWWSRASKKARAEFLPYLFDSEVVVTDKDNVRRGMEWWLDHWVKEAKP